MPKYISVDSSVEVVDSLSSDKSGAALSAKQGKNLNTKINNIKIPQLIAGSGIGIESKDSVYKISADPNNINKYKDSKIATMVSKWSTKQLPTAHKYSSMSYSDDLRLLVLVAEDSSSVFVTRDNNTFKEIVIDSSIGITGFNKICYSKHPHKFCAVAKNANKAITSFDGYTWDSGNVSTLPDTAEYKSICYSEELRIFCAISYNNNKVAVSMDGTTWLNRTLPIANMWVDIVWAPKLHKFIIVAKNSDKIATSINGIDWDIVTLPSSQDYRAISYSTKHDTLCIAVYNSDKLLVSGDGETWFNSVALPRAMKLTSITYAPQISTFCCMEEDSSKLIVSTDGGYNWSEKDLDNSNNKKWSTVGYNANVDMFLGAAYDTDIIICSRSLNVINMLWKKEYTLPKATQSDSNWSIVEYVSEKDTLYTFMSKDKRIATSTDGGKTWMLSNDSNRPFPYNFGGLNYNPKLHTFIGIYSKYNSGSYYTYSSYISEDYGKTWNGPYSIPKSNSQFGSWQFYHKTGFVYSYELDSFYVTCSDNAEKRILTTKDGKTWRTIQLPTGNTRFIYAIPSHEYKAAAYSIDNVTYDHWLYVTKDGEIWEQRSLGKYTTGGIAHNMCYSEDLGVFCLLFPGASSFPIKTMISPDLNTWTTYTNKMLPDQQYSSEAFTWLPKHQMFISISNSKSCIVSPNGIDWTTIPIEPSFTSHYGCTYLDKYDCFITSASISNDNCIYSATIEL